ncbi:MAG: BlaI/MecI/CopY family transcriptional regulator [Clostridia bacterium]|nr:BlaI/MecI/CopY family transcriptional regulator [Clostridia bacterium]
MNDIKRIPDSELEIMMIIWEAGQSVSADYIMDRIDKTWTKTTLLNFLTRLCSRGFLDCSKEGRRNLYTPIVDKEVYLQKESKSFLNRLYHNSLTGLVASLYDGKSVSKEDLAELKRYIEEAE